LVTVETRATSPSVHYEYGFDGQHGWEIPFGAAGRVLEGKALDECREAAKFSLDEPEDFISMRGLGAASFDGRKCWALKLVRKSGREEIHYYDAANYLLDGIVRFSAANASWTMATFRDYRDFGGFKFPTWIADRRRQNNYVIRLRSIEVNTVADSVFKLPLSGSGSSAR
jgi:hypothetical protein